MKNAKIVLYVLSIVMLLQANVNAADLNPMEQMLADELINMFGPNTGQGANTNDTTYRAYCINGRIVVDARSPDKIFRQYPMSSNDVYSMMQFNDPNQANHWAAGQNYRCPRRR